MPRRLAASLALLVFAICLIAGMQSGNTLATVLSRSLIAMAGTMFIAWIVGAMAERMLEENLQDKERQLREAGAGGAAETESDGPGRTH